MNSNSATFKELFETKVLRGLIPTTQEWNDYLLRIYREQPACSPRVFAQHQTELGVNSYELLAQTLRDFYQSESKIVDLGTGSGFLINYLRIGLADTGHIIGVDMSNEEIAIARQEFAQDPRIRFVVANAQALPLGAESTDLVAAHMSLMLMQPIENVVEEIHRILKPSGRFMAVLSGESPSEGILLEVEKAISDFIVAEFPKVAPFSVGDARTRSSKGLKSLFLPSFSEIERLQEFHLNMTLSPAEVWQFCNTFVRVNLLPEAQKKVLSKIIMNIALKYISSEGHVSLRMPLALVSVRK